jgi:peptide/nickel transport system substrate-binding protein
MESFRIKLRAHITSLQSIYRTLSPERVLVVWTLLALSAITLISACILMLMRYTDVVPTFGGTVREGIIGTPRFINPVLATTEQDNNLTTLVYAGLTKRNDGEEIVLDLASSIISSEDGLRFDVTLKPDAAFHDGTRVTADDVIYTIGLVQNPNIKSPHRVEWEGVTLEKKSDTEFSISFRKPYPLAMNIFTLGILPKHVWKNLTDEQFSLSSYNINAIGSGPFKIDKVITDAGIPVTFELSSYKRYTLGRPYIDKISITTYQNERYALQAFKDGDIDRIHSITPEKVMSLDVSTSSIQTSLLPRTFTVFFNPNKADFLSDKTVRRALNMAIDKQAIVDTVLLGYGKVVETPYPFDTDQPAPAYNPEEAEKLLATTKYAPKASSTLSITLATGNSDDMRRVAEMIQADWAKIGVTTELAVYEYADLNQSVIRDRNYQALLFGTISSSPTDLYAFWHSSQRNYPGLNISNYVSNSLDTDLTTLRNEIDPVARAEAYASVKEEFYEETPGIFLFAPSLIYITRDKITTPLPATSLDTSSRFARSTEWYRYTERVWKNTYYKPLLTILQNSIH